MVNRRGGCRLAERSIRSVLKDLINNDWGQPLPLDDCGLLGVGTLAGCPPGAVKTLHALDVIGAMVVV